MCLLFSSLSLSLSLYFFFKEKGLHLLALQVVQNASAVAGLSLGEYTALVFAGALSFEEGLRVVKVRAESMADTARMGEPHGMLSIIGLGDGEIEAICGEIRSEMPCIDQTSTVCQLANYLFPQVLFFLVVVALFLFISPIAF